MEDWHLSWMTMVSSAFRFGCSVSFLTRHALQAQFRADLEAHRLRAEALACQQQAGYSHGPTFPALHTGMGFF